MRLAIDDTQITVTLSRRNLLALLHKLDWPLSHRRLESSNAYMDGREISLSFAVCAEDDDAHYDDRTEPAGAMHPLTESFIASAEIDLDAEDGDLFDGLFDGLDRGPS